MLNNFSSVVKLDSIIITKETTINGQTHNFFQQHDFESEDDETFGKMMVLCKEGKLSELEELIDNHDDDTEDTEDAI